MIPSTTPEQQERLRELHADSDAWIGYWCSDAWGRSANGGSTDEKWHAEPGAVQEIDEDLRLECCPMHSDTGGLHATDAPHRWQGDRVWLVALHGDLETEGGKRAARRREIICEIRPSDVLNPQIAARLELTDLPMRYTNLRDADLRDADLQYADLRYADLRYTNLQYADLRDADLRDANLRYTNLQYADLRYADLRDANLQDADLRDADLRDADLRDADLQYANLGGSTVSERSIDAARTNEYTRLPDKMSEEK